MVIFHHNDADGRCAAAIVFMWACMNRIIGERINFVEVDYKDIPELRFQAHVQPGEDVFVVDFSFPVERFRELLKLTPGVTWIDHHRTSEQILIDLENDSDGPTAVDGKWDFRAKGEAACELTWKYCFANKTTPTAVTLIGDYDSWRHEDARSKPFHEGLKMEDTRPSALVWGALLPSKAKDVDKTVGRIVDRGRAGMDYRDQYCSSMVESFGHEVRLDGLFMWAVNVYGFGSQTFKNIPDKYDAVAAYIFDGSQFTVSLYANGDDVDVAKVCKKWGGGGHKGAAGFETQQLPWSVILRK